ncbi:MAG: hypothetical protein IPK05_19725 [Comamonadaceae bacterium]|nr:hypothetical protein [Comamonadaceae bacterium]
MPTLHSFHEPTGASARRRIASVLSSGLLNSSACFARRFGGGELRLAGAHRRVRGLGQAHRLVQGQRSWGGRGLGTRGVCNGGQREGQRHEGESHRIILFVSQQQSDSAGKGRDGASCLADATQPRRRSVRQG